MKIRIRARRPIAFASAVLMSGALLGAAVVPSLATNTVAAATVHHRMPDAAIEGCDVLLEAPAGHHCLLPWPNDAFTVAARTTDRPAAQHLVEGRPGQHQGRARRHRRAEQGRRVLARRGDHDVRPGAEHREVEDRDLDRTSASRSRANAPIVHPRHGDARRGCRTSPSSTRRPSNPAEAAAADPSRGRVDRRPSLRGRAAQPRTTPTASRIAPLASTTAALAGTLQARRHAARTSGGSSGTTSRRCSASTVPFQAWDFTVASAKSLAGPALTMRKLAYEWLDTHHVAAAVTAAVERLRARRSPSRR